MKALTWLQMAVVTPNGAVEKKLNEIFSKKKQL